MSLQNLKLFELFRSSEDESAFNLAVIKELKVLSEYEESDGIKSKLHNTYMFLKAKWKASSRTTENFMKKNSPWLNELTIFKNSQKAHTSTDRIRGRPSKSLEECSSFTRKRKLQGVTDVISTAHLSEALSIKYAKDQEKVRSDVTKVVAIASPLRLHRIKESIPTPPNASPTKYTMEEALALFMEKLLRKSIIFYEPL